MRIQQQQQKVSLLNINNLNDMTMCNVLRSLGQERLYEIFE